MQILGVSRDVDRATVRPTSDWPLSARCRREHRRRDEMRARARVAFGRLSDRKLWIGVAVELAEELEDMGGDPPPGFPDVSTMTRGEMLDYLAEGAVPYVPDVEVVHPDAIDPTA